MNALATGAFALAFFAPLAFIYGRRVAAKFHAGTRAGRRPAALAVSQLVMPAFVAASIATRLADPLALALWLGPLAGNGALAAVVFGLRSIGALALVLFFLAIPFVIGRLFGIGAALAGFFENQAEPAPDPVPHDPVAQKEAALSDHRAQGRATALTIAIDGPAAAGKGTLAKRLAAHYALPYLDTGLLYRAVGRIAFDSGLELEDASAMGEVARRLDIAAIDEPRLRGREAGELASRVAVHLSVRAALTDFQRAFASRPGGAVLDGRDIGTVICPDADVKIFVTASAEVRAHRRTDELNAKGRDVSYERILAEVRERDLRDAGRAEAPLKAAADAHLLDTSKLDIEAAFRAACDLIDRAMAGRAEG